MKITEYLEYITHDERQTEKHLTVYKKMFSGIKNMRILDIGCGTGSLASMWVNENQVFGLDAEEKCVIESQKKGISAIQLRLPSQLPWTGNFFDIVICKDVLEHLLTPEDTLQEIKRVLKPNGLFLAHVPNEFNLLDRLQVCLGKSFVKKRWFQHANPWDYPHIRFFTKATFRQFLEKHQFEIRKDYSYEWSFLTLKFLGKIRSELFSPGITFLCKNKK